jgi:RNA polymerase sigma-70 factor, ECF subfamily
MGTNAMPERAAEVFAAVRPLLFSIAYRMVGSVMDAEDLVQETYLRWQEAAPADIRSPQAYLATIVTRLAINHLHSARVQRETYVGTWLPEPLVTEPAPDPSGSIELAESLSMAFLVLLERLSPTERAVFLLHEVFDFEYAEIARIVEKSEVNCRQILTRARQHIGDRRVRFAASTEQAERLTERFAAAAVAGDFDALIALLAADITLWSDGGGKARGAALNLIHGVDPVARFVVGTARRFAHLDRTVRPAVINGQQGFITYLSGAPVSVVVLDIVDDRIHAIYAIGNPDKLRTLPPE